MPYTLLFLGGSTTFRNDVCFVESEEICQSCRLYLLIFYRCSCLEGRFNSAPKGPGIGFARSEEHTSELQLLMRMSYADFCLKKKIPRPLTAYAQTRQYRIST